MISFIFSCLYYIFCSMVLLWPVWVIYNLFFSPLCSIPGPILSQIIPFYDYYFMANGNFHKYILNLHEVYGPTVRLGGEKVSFNSPEDWKQIHQTYKFSKSDFYNYLRSEGHSTITINDKEAHKTRRRVIAKTFSEANILKLEKAVKDVGVNVLLEKIEQAYFNSNDSTIELSKNFLFLTYDVIGKLVFSENLNILKYEHHDILDWSRNIFIWILLNAALPPTRLIGNPYIKKTAMLAKESIDRRKQQLENGNLVDNDILGGLIDAEDPKTGEKLSQLDLMEECAELMIAGSDTTYHSLTWLVYTILKHPETKKAIVEEIDINFKRLDDVNYKDCQKKLVYLNAVMKEVIRLYPVTSHPMLRIVPEEGAILGGYFLPPKTEIMTNCYAFQRSSQHWSSPNAFLPERFLTKDAGSSDFSTYIQAFSSGPRSCIGRPLAMLELTLTVVMMFKKFEINLVDPEREVEDINYLILRLKEPNSLPVTIKLRE